MATPSRREKRAFAAELRRPAGESLLVAPIQIFELGIHVSNRDTEICILCPSHFDVNPQFRGLSTVRAVVLQSARAQTFKIGMDRPRW